MQLRHRVALDGRQLDEIDWRIMIQKIETADGKENISAVSLMGGSGSRVTSEHRDSLDVTVKFTLRLRKTEMAEQGIPGTGPRFTASSSGPAACRTGRKRTRKPYPSRTSAART